MKALIGLCATIFILFFVLFFYDIYKADELVYFRFEPKKVVFDGLEKGLDKNRAFGFEPDNKTHRLEYEKPDGSVMRVELYPRDDDDPDLYLEVRLNGVSGTPRHRIVSKFNP